MAHHASSLFRPSNIHQPRNLLFLVENSQNLQQAWPQLRDFYLARLLEAFIHANPSSQPSISVIESFPAADRAPRQYADPIDTLWSVSFSPVPENRISVGRISECIDYMNAQPTGQPSSSLHLVIVAASTPSDDSATSPNAWALLSDRLAKSRIHLHLVAAPQEDLSPLTVLFEDTLRLQQFVEETPPFPVDRLHTILRLSARPTYAPYHDPSEPSSSSYPLRPTQQQLRRNSYPLDNFYPASSSSSTSAPVYDEPLSAPGSAHPNSQMYHYQQQQPPHPLSQSHQPQQHLNGNGYHVPSHHQPQHHSASNGYLIEDDSPSLVSQLQQVHGLTKKKVYGKQPTRQPFIGAERVRDPISGLGLHPANSPPLPTGSLPLGVGGHGSANGPTSSPTVPIHIPTSLGTSNGSPQASSPTISTPPLSNSSPTTLTSRYRKPHTAGVNVLGAIPASASSPGSSQGGRMMTMSRADRMQRVKESGPVSPVDGYGGGGYMHGPVAGHGTARRSIGSLSGFVNAPQQQQPAPMPMQGVGYMQGVQTHHSWHAHPHQHQHHHPIHPHQHPPQGSTSTPEPDIAGSPASISSSAGGSGVGLMSSASPSSGASTIAPPTAHSSPPLPSPNLVPSPGAAPGSSSASPVPGMPTSSASPNMAMAAGAAGGMGLGLNLAASMSAPALLGSSSVASYSDISPGSNSTSSYVSSDMSAPATPGSMEELYAHARAVPMQHGVMMANGGVVGGMVDGTSSAPVTPGGDVINGVGVEAGPGGWATSSAAAAAAVAQAQQQVADAQVQAHAVAQAQANAQMELQYQQGWQIQHLQDQHAWAQQSQVAQQAQQIQQLRDAHVLQAQAQAQAQVQQVHVIQQQHAAAAAAVAAAAAASASESVPVHPAFHGGYNPASQYFPPVPVSVPLHYGQVVGPESVHQQIQQAQQAQLQARAQQAQAVQAIQAQAQAQAQAAQPGVYQSLVYDPYPGLPVSTSPPPIVPSHPPRPLPGPAILEPSQVLASAAKTSPKVLPSSHSQRGKLGANAGGSATTSGAATNKKSSTKHKKGSSISVPPTTPTSASTPPNGAAKDSSGGAGGSTTNTSTTGTDGSSPEEERFTFGKEFIAATKVLFEEEVLPAYPHFPGMASGLLTGSAPLAGGADGADAVDAHGVVQPKEGMMGKLGTGQPAQTGELYATRNKTKAAKAKGRAAGGGGAGASAGGGAGAGAGGSSSPIVQSNAIMATAPGVATGGVPIPVPVPLSIAVPPVPLPIAVPAVVSPGALAAAAAAKAAAAATSGSPIIHSVGMVTTPGSLIYASPGGMPRSIPANATAAGMVGGQVPYSYGYTPA